MDIPDNPKNRTNLFRDKYLFKKLLIPAPIPPQ